MFDHFQIATVPDVIEVELPGFPKISTTLIGWSWPFPSKFHPVRIVLVGTVMAVGTAGGPPAIDSPDTKTSKAIKHCIVFFISLSLSFQTTIMAIYRPPVRYCSYCDIV